MRYWLAALLLTGIAVTNRVVVAVDTLSPWELGGFGMFASVDSPGSRVVRITAEAADGTTGLVSIPQSISSSEDQLRVWPTLARLQSFAGRVEQLKFSIEDGIWVEDPNGLEVEVQQIEVFKLVGLNGGVTLETIATLDEKP